MPECRQKDFLEDVIAGGIIEPVAPRNRVHEPRMLIDKDSPGGFIARDATLDKLGQ